MQSEVMDSPADFCITSSSPGQRHAWMHDCYDQTDGELSAHFQECRQVGRPFIVFHQEDGIFRYIYFDRSQPPSSELMDRLGALACSFGASHRHVLYGDVFEEYLDTPRALAYQGRFIAPLKGWSPEQAEAFATQLSRLLPRFDRKAELESLVERAISAGYFDRSDDWPFGDEALETDAKDAYEDRCRLHRQPFIILDRDDAAFSYEVPGEALAEEAVSAINSLARSFGLEPDEYHSGGWN